MRYKPDTWVILEITKGDEIYHKVLGGWHGGYAYGDSWRANSGIEKITKEGNYYHIHGYSGSVYKVHEESERFSMITSGIYSEMKDSTSDYSVEHIDIADIIDRYK